MPDTEIDAIAHALNAMTPPSSTVRGQLRSVRNPFKAAQGQRAWLTILMVIQNDWDCQDAALCFVSRIINIGYRVVHPPVLHLQVRTKF